jgi:hypothetical protein
MISSHPPHPALPDTPASTAGAAEAEPTDGTLRSRLGADPREVSSERAQTDSFTEGRTSAREDDLCRNSPEEAQREIGRAAIDCGLRAASQAELVRRIKRLQLEAPALIALELLKPLATSFHAMLIAVESLATPFVPAPAWDFMLTLLDKPENLETFQAELEKTEEPRTP